jgi:hypothetical protein
VQFELTIAGLCLLVDDPTADAVHVLMPTTVGHHPHEVRLLHPAASARQKDLITGYATDFAGLVAAGAGRPRIPENVLDIARACSAVGVVPRRVLDHPDQSKVAHATLRGGTITVLGDEECCIIDGVEVRGAGRLRWTVDVAGASRTLAVNSLRGTPARIQVPLFVSAHMLRVGLVHAIPSQIPETLEDLLQFGPSDFSHFDSFYKLYHSTACNSVPSACSKGAAAEGAPFYPSQCMPGRGVAA